MPADAAELRYEPRPEPGVVGNVVIEETDAGTLIRVLHARRPTYGWAAAFLLLAILLAVVPAYEAWKTRTLGPAFQVGMSLAAVALAAAVVAALPWRSEPSTISATAAGLEQVYRPTRRTLAWRRDEIATVEVREPTERTPYGWPVLGVRNVDGTWTMLGCGPPDEVEPMAAALRRGLGIEAAAGGEAGRTP